VDSRCRSVQLALVEASGDVDRLEQAQRAHAAECSACAEVASAEQRLGQLLEQGAPPFDPRLEATLLAAVGRARARRRIYSLLPVAASLALALLGALLVGGVPGSGLLSLVPAWSAEGWMALAGAAASWGVGLAAIARTMAELLPGEAALGAAAFSLAGIVLLVLLMRRWRRSPAWRRGI
jgi:hypothetical protein